MLPHAAEKLGPYCSGTTEGLKVCTRPMKKALKAMMKMPETERAAKIEAADSAIAELEATCVPVSPLLPYSSSER